MAQRYFLNGTAFLVDDCKHSSCCTIEICPLAYAFIEHTPNLGGTAFFIAIFSILLIAQLGLGFFHRTWYFSSAMVCGLILEVLGYAGRLMMRSNPFSFSAFLLNLIPLTIGPAFMCAGIYICLGRIVVTYGESMSRLRPWTYTVIFVSSDMFSLILQAVGGAVTSVAPDSNRKLGQAGTNVMLAGLSSQVGSLVLFLVLCTEFGFRVRAQKQNWNEENRAVWNSGRWPIFLIGLGLATTTILVRSSFRVAELSQGFRGPLANNEVTYMILEGTMVSIASIALTVAHPGYSLKGTWSQAGFSRNKPSKTKEETHTSTSSVDAV